MDAPARSYLTVVFRYWKLLAAITLIPTVLAVTLVFLVLTPVYEGETRIIFPLARASSFVRRSLTEMELPVTGIRSLLETAPTIYNHIVIIESRTLARRVYEYLKSEKNIDLVLTYRGILNDDKLDEEGRLRAVYGRMQKRVHVDDRERGMAIITFVHTDATVAAEVANAYVSETLGFLNEVNRSTQSDLATFLEARQAEVEDALEQAEAEIEQVKEETGILSVEEQARQLISSYADIEALVAQAEIDYEGSLSQARGMSSAGMDMGDYYAWLAAGEGPEESPPVPAIDALADQAIIGLRSQLSDLELKRQETMLWATPDNPEVVLLNSELEAVRTELYREFADYYDAAVAGLMVETTAYRAQLDVAQEVLAGLDARLDAFPPEERRLIELQRDRDVQESVYLVITQELEQARIQRLREEAPFTVLDEALVPTKPVRPRKLVITVGTFAVSFWLGILVVFWVDSARRRPTGA
jgi:uncharacterized protein involved in exopolysaccharide biosynthesis